MFLMKLGVGAKLDDRSHLYFVSSENENVTIKTSVICAVGLIPLLQQTQYVNEDVMLR